MLKGSWGGGGLAHSQKCDQGRKDEWRYRTPGREQKEARGYGPLGVEAHQTKTEDDAPGPRPGQDAQECDGTDRDLSKVQCKARQVAGLGEERKGRVNPVTRLFRQGFRVAASGFITLNGVAGNLVRAVPP